MLQPHKPSLPVKFWACCSLSLENAGQVATQALRLFRCYSYRKCLNSSCSSSPTPCPAECAFPSVPRARATAMGVQCSSTPSGSLPAYSVSSSSPDHSSLFPSANLSIWDSELNLCWLHQRIEEAWESLVVWNATEEVLIQSNASQSVVSGTYAAWVCSAPPPLPGREKFKGVFYDQITLRNAARTVLWANPQLLMVEYKKISNRSFHYCTGSQSVPPNQRQQHLRTF